MRLKCPKCQENHQIDPTLPVSELRQVFYNVWACDLCPAPFNRWMKVGSGEGQRFVLCETAAIAPLDWSAV